MRDNRDRRILGLAARQHSIFTRTQALHAGFTPRMIQGRLTLGLWKAWYRGVYGVAGVPRTPEGEAMAASLATSAPVARASAALLWGVPCPPPSGIEVLAMHGTRRGRPGIIVCQSTRVLRSDVATLGAIPITTPARTILDLASILDVSDLETALDDALARRLVTLDRLARRTAGEAASRRRGLGDLRDLIAEYSPLAAESKSHLAQAFLRLFRRVGLPEPEVEMPIALPGGRVIHSDLGYRSERVAIELQSRRWHTGRRKTTTDLERENDLEVAGFRLVHLLAEHRRRPDYVRWTVSRALNRAG